MARIKDLPKFARPREKLFEKGPDTLKDYELLAILLRTGYKGKSAIEVAKRILSSFPLDKLQKLAPQEMVKLKGIGRSRASIIAAALELSKRAFQIEKDITFSTPEDVFKVTSFLADKKKEYLVVLYLDVRNRLIKTHTISIGTLDASLIHPREVFAPAIQNRAAQLIIVHNHPSGDVNYGVEDELVTKQLVDAGRILGIPVLDHIIVSKKNYLSLANVNSHLFDEE